MEITIITQELSSQKLKNFLESNDDFKELNVDLKLQKSEITTRGSDSQLLIAIIPPTLTVIIELIKLIITIHENKKQSTIKIELNDGTKIEIPIDYPTEKMNSLIQNVNFVDINRILFLNYLQNPLDAAQ